MDIHPRLDPKASGGWQGLGRTGLKGRTGASLQASQDFQGKTAEVT